MGVELGVWVDVMRTHPASYRFTGIDGWHSNVGAAVSSDESFMTKHMEDIYETHERELEKAMKAREDLDEMLTQFCSYIADHTSYSAWQEELPEVTWSPTIKEPEVLMRIIERMDDETIRHNFIESLSPEPSWEWDSLKDPAMAEYLLGEHPLEAMKSHASGSAVDIGDVVFICPGCHREPVSFEDFSAKSYYCGLCACEAIIDVNETILDFFVSLEVEVFPFDKEAKERWVKHFAGYADLAEDVDTFTWYTERLALWKSGKFLDVEKPVTDS